MTNNLNKIKLCLNDNIINETDDFFLGAENWLMFDISFCVIVFFSNAFLFSLVLHSWMVLIKTTFEIVLPPQLKWNITAQLYLEQCFCSFWYNKIHFQTPGYFYCDFEKRSILVIVYEILLLTEINLLLD